VTFKVLFVFVVLEHERRRILHINVTDTPTAQWTAQEIVEAFPWDTAPRYVLRSRPIEPPERGTIIPIPEVGGLHHRYVRHAA
jgi:hypothetical protein